MKSCPKAHERKGPGDKAVILYSGKLWRALQLVKQSPNDIGNIIFNLVI